MRINNAKQKLQQFVSGLSDVEAENFVKASISAVGLKVVGQIPASGTLRCLDAGTDEQKTLVNRTVKNLCSAMGTSEAMRFLAGMDQKGVKLIDVVNHIAAQDPGGVPAMPAMKWNQDGSPALSHLADTSKGDSSNKSCAPPMPTMKYKDGKPDYSQLQ